MAVRWTLCPLLVIFGTTLACGSAPAGSGRDTGAEPQDLPGGLDDLAAQYAVVPLPFDASGLSPQDRRLVRELAAAGQLLERAFWQQSWPGGWQQRQRLARSKHAQERQLLRLLEINAGPFDLEQAFRPFLGAAPRPAGGGFYPPDLTAEELDTYLQAQPQERGSLLSPHTVVERRGGELVAVPFGRAYQEWTEPASAHLARAAELAGDDALRGFLQSRAAALLDDRYDAGDEQWNPLAGTPWVVVLGPRDARLDALKKTKRAYEMSIGVKDAAENRRLAAYAQGVAALEQRLPLAAAHKRPGVKLDFSMLAVNDLFRGGLLAHGDEGVLVLPVAESARARRGAWRLFAKNVMTARVDALVRPAARRLLVAQQLDRIDEQAYFDLLAMHHVAHGVGPREVAAQGRAVPLREVFGQRHGALEETKADLVALDALDWAIDEGLLPAELRSAHPVTYLVLAFLNLHDARQGRAPERHGTAAAIALNWLRERGALRLDPEQGRWRLDERAAGGHLRALTQEVLEIQATGDLARAASLVERYTALDPQLEATLRELAALRPTAVRATFSPRWE